MWTSWHDMLSRCGSQSRAPKNLAGLHSTQAPPSSRDSAPGQFIEAGDARAGAGLLRQVANQFDNTELGVHRIQHRCMREQVEARAVFDGPLDRAPNRFEEMLQLPASVAEAAHVA